MPAGFATNACRPSSIASSKRSCTKREAFVAALQGGPATGLTLDDAREATRIGIAMRQSLRKAGRR